MKATLKNTDLRKEVLVTAIAVRKFLEQTGQLVKTREYTRVYTEARVSGYRTKLVGYGITTPIEELQAMADLLIAGVPEAYRDFTVTVQKGGRKGGGAPNSKNAMTDWYYDVYGADNCYHIFVDLKQD